MTPRHATPPCLLILCLLAAHAASGAQRIVGQPGTPCPNAQYKTLTAAVAAANAGDEIDICPAVYTDQLVITKPLTLRGISVRSSDGTEITGIDRVVLRPELSDLQNLATEAVITVLNTHDVTLDNLAIDASQNAVTGCAPGVAGIHFLNASGTVQNSAVYNAELPNPLSCTTLPYGNGFGVLVDATTPGPFEVRIRNNSLHDYTANGIQLNGTGGGVVGHIEGNSISGVGPASGIFQFGIFVTNGAVGHIHHNVISEGLCGSLSSASCITVRSEGVTLRAIGDGSSVEDNVITNAQSGIFINGANRLSVARNLIQNIDAMSGLDVQASASGYFTNSVLSDNRIGHVFPVDADASNDEEGCGINEYSGTGTFGGNRIERNVVSDAYCGVAHVTTDTVNEGTYTDVLYTLLNSDLYPNTFPSAEEP